LGLLIEKPFHIGAVFFMSGLLSMRCLLLGMTIAEAYRRFQRVDLRGQVPLIIELTAEQIISLNQSQLYGASLDSLGNELGGYWQEWYEDLKKSMNPALGGKVDLNLTGDFYRGFYVEVKGENIIIGSSDSKSDDLESKYGKAIFGLSQESKEDYTLNIFFNSLKNYIEGITKVQMT
jgi:hypothetical protein